MSDNLKAQNEGWMLLVAAMHNPRIVMSYPTWSGRKFKTHEKALEYVQEKAASGSPFHERAIVALTKTLMHGAEDM